MPCSLKKALLTCAAILVTTSAAASDFGQVELVEGDVIVRTADGRASSPKVGDTIPEGAEIDTGKDGELHVATTDSGYVALRPDTQLRVTQYVAEGNALDTQVLSLLRGTFRSITGWIGRDTPDRYRITTPTATIGVRGTDHEPAYIPPDDASTAPGDDRAPGTYDKVNEGGSFIENDAGRVEIGASQSGFAAHGRAPPARLARIPRFFRATRNERRIVVRREALRKVIEQRRAERRRHLRERRERRRRRRRRRANG